MKEDMTNKKRIGIWIDEDDYIALRSILIKENKTFVRFIRESIKKRLSNS